MATYTPKQTQLRALLSPKKEAVLLYKNAAVSSLVPTIDFPGKATDIVAELDKQRVPLQVRK